MADHRDFDVKVDSEKSDSGWSEREQKVLSIADWLDARLGVRFWSVAGLVAASLIFGTPHMLVQHQCYGRCGQYTTEFNCQYLGIRGWKVVDAEQGRCPRFRLL
jgi:hypothetical protein